MSLLQKFRSLRSKSAETTDEADETDAFANEVFQSLEAKLEVLPDGHRYQVIHHDPIVDAYLRAEALLRAERYAEQWPTVLRGHIRWFFTSYAAGRLPMQPYLIDDGRLVCDPAALYDSIAKRLREPPRNAAELRELAQILGLLRRNT